MKLRSAVFSCVLAATSVAAVACGGSVETPQTTASAASKAPVAQNAHGAVKVVGEALGEVALRTEQRTEIEKLAAEAEARHQPMVEGRTALMTAFADQVEKGAIDRSALQAKIDRVGHDLATARAADRAALVKLHDLLDKQQRNDFADALEKHVKGKRGELHIKGEAGSRGMGHLKALADEMNLTDDQKSKIHDVIKESFKEGMKEAREQRRVAFGGHGKKHGGNPIEAFREDTLDLPDADPTAMTAGGAEHILKTAEKLLPILTPEQRKLAADKLRTMATDGNAALLVH